MVKVFQVTMAGVHDAMTLLIGEGGATLIYRKRINISPHERVLLEQWKIMAFSEVPKGTKIRIVEKK